MKKKIPARMNLTIAEKQRLRENKLKISDILNFAVDELEVLLSIPFERAREIHALSEFQTMPSVGIRFAEDLVFMGFFSLNDLKGKDGAKLTDEYERKKGYWIDPCVEDQFRLSVYYANTLDSSKKWWDFTEERKRYRLEYGYPVDRPKKAWY